MSTKPFQFIRFGAMDVTKPYKSIRFGAMDVTKPYKFIGRRLPARTAHALASVLWPLASGTPGEHEGKAAGRGVLPASCSDSGECGGASCLANSSRNCGRTYPGNGPIGFGAMDVTKPYKFIGLGPGMLPNPINL